jgi:cation diffusion facilitator CzcD-associated flavoprotein CzcO
MLDRPENKVINVKDNPIVKVVENGIVTADGKVHECDVIALATGFDSVTGGMKVRPLIA